MACKTSHDHINVDFIVGKNVPTDVKVVMDKELERVMDCFDSFFDTNITLKVAYITEKDSDLVQNSLPSIMGSQELDGLKNVLTRYSDKVWGPTGGGGGGVAGRNSFGTNYYLVLHLASYTNASSYMVKNVMHEFTHVLQAYGRKDMRTQGSTGWYQNVPGYFVEGGAESLAYNFSEITASGYNAQVNRSSRDMTNGSPSARNLKDVDAGLSLLETLKNPTSQDAQNLQYPFGSLVCDYIMGKYGIDKYLALMKGASKYANWADNVNATLGISEKDLETSAITWGLPIWNAAAR